MDKVQLTKAQRAKRRRRIIRQTRGAVFVLLALIGIGTIVSMTVRGIRSALSGDDEKETYTALVAPLVAEDPVPFESIDKANISMLTECNAQMPPLTNGIINYSFVNAQNFAILAQKIARP